MKYRESDEWFENLLDDLAEKVYRGEISDELDPELQEDDEESDAEHDDAV